MINFNFLVKGNVAIDYLVTGDEIELEPIIKDVIKNHGHKVLNSQKMISKFEENFITYVNEIFRGHVLDYIVHEVNVKCEIENQTFTLSGNVEFELTDDSTITIKDIENVQDLDKELEDVFGIAIDEYNELIDATVLSNLMDEYCDHEIEFFIIIFQKALMLECSWIRRIASMKLTFNTKGIIEIDYRVWLDNSENEVEKATRKVIERYSDSVVDKYLVQETIINNKRDCLAGMLCCRPDNVEVTACNVECGMINGEFTLSGTYEFDITNGLRNDELPSHDALVDNIITLVYESIHTYGDFIDDSQLRSRLSDKF